MYIIKRKKVTRPATEVPPVKKSIEFDVARVTHLSTLTIAMIPKLYSAIGL